MINRIQLIKSNGFYISFFFLFCLYAILLRLNSIPSAFTYALYALCILYSIKKLLEKGLTNWYGKGDVIAIFFFLIYYFISGLFYAMLDDNTSWLLKDYLYSLLPILFYIFVRLSKVELNAQALLFVSWLSILIIDIISITLLFLPNSFIGGLFNRELLEFEGVVSFALSGLLGVILIGFINIIGLIICLFSPIKISKLFKVCTAVFFVVCAFLTGQRTPVAGLLIILLIYIFQKKGKALFILSAIIGVLFISLPYVDIEIENISLKETMSDRFLYRFSNVKGGDTGRNEQYVIYNDDNLFELLLGDGVGRHSPENEYSNKAMPDAMLFRIFNEMGVVGLTLYLFFFYLNIIRAIRTRNWFAISLVIYAFFANSFNRVLFTAPLSILPYVLIAYFNWSSGAEKLSYKRSIIV